MNEGIQKSVKWTSQNEKYEINSNTENTFTDQAVVWQKGFNISPSHVECKRWKEDARMWFDQIQSAGIYRKKCEKQPVYALETLKKY